jgi:hypothetical protein
MLDEIALDLYEREADVEASDVVGCYFEKFLIHPMQITLTFVRSPEAETQAM